MALRDIRIEGDPVLRKIARPVDCFDERLHILLDDMKDTMQNARGVGLAAPQVGVRKRIVVIDALEEGILEIINPEFLETQGKQCGKEGCLSIPDQSDYVRRPQRIKVRAQNRLGEVFELDAVDYLAVVLNHEADHLDGILYIDKAIDPTPEELAALEKINEDQLQQENENME